MLNKIKQKYNYDFCGFYKISSREYPYITAYQEIAKIVNEITNSVGVSIYPYKLDAIRLANFLGFYVTDTKKKIFPKDVLSFLTISHENKKLFGKDKVIVLNEDRVRNKKKT